MHEIFRKVSHKTADIVGSPWAFIIAVAVIVGWAVAGPYFDHSDSWQLFINTGTTILTFLMVFLIQNTQNRDAKAIHLKLDELLRGDAKDRRETFIELQELPDEDLEKIEEEFERIRNHYRRKLAERKHTR